MVAFSRKVIISGLLLSFQSLVTGSAEDSKWIVQQTSDNDDRQLQDGADPCIAGDVLYRLYDSFDVFAPSFFSNCSASLSVDSENMKLHVQSLKKVFEQYHCFYDIAKNPEDSDPAGFQPEFGNTIYGEGGGKVDLEAGLDALLADIETNGASLATFWEINSVFNPLYDGHVGMPSVEQDFSNYFYIVFPERFDNDPSITFDSILAEVFLDENKTLQMTIFTFENGQVLAKEVETINEQSVLDYIVYLANSPDLNLPYQDLGARVNLLIQVGALFSGIGGSGVPSNLLPDSFDVTYMDGTNETLRLGVIASTPFYSWTNVNREGVVSVDREEAELFINQPGEQYDAWQRATQEVEGLQRTRGLATPQEEIPRPPGIGKRSTLPRQLQDDAPFFFNETIPGIGGYSVQDDYVVMKLNTFIVGLDDIIWLWTNTTAAAQEFGIKRLIVDISGNGGGSIAAGFALIFMMFPAADLEWFVNEWDINYNEPMFRYLWALVPIVDIILNEVAELPNESFEELIDSFTRETFAVYQAAGDGILELCNDAVNPFDEFGSVFQCIQAAYLQSNVTTFVDSPDINTYVDLFVSLIETTLHYNPWSVVLEQVESSNQNITNDLMIAGIQNFIRGGVQSNVTAKFDILGDLLELIYDGVRPFNVDYTFDQYVFVSDGLSGSMAAIFPFKASQLHKNRDLSGVETRVTLTAYGGTGNAEDFTISSFPASVQGVHLEDPIIGDAALRMMVGLLPTNLTSIDTVVEAVADYTETVAVPPFFGDTLPIMPVVNYYDSFMEPGALQLQYVKIPLDEYIPVTYSRVSFADPADLPFLYADAAQFFTDPTPAPVTPAPVTPQPTTAAPTAVHSAAPTSLPTGSPTAIAPSTAMPGPTSDPPTTEGPTATPSGVSSLMVSSGLIASFASMCLILL